MRHPIPTGIFKQSPTSGEKKGDATTRAAQEITDGETAAREAKTERLRQARLAKEAAEPIVVPKPKTRSAKSGSRS